MIHRLLLILAEKFTMMVKASTTGVPLSQLKYVYIAHSLISYMMSGKLIDDTLLDDIIDVSTSGTINDQSFTLHLRSLLRIR